MKVRKAVFPVAGMGTRFLPATKAMPKEMLPVVDKPLIQYAVEEALKAGRRVLTLRQAFNAREGLTPDKIDLPDRIKNESLKSGQDTLPKIDFQALREGFFTAMGWDAKTGRPSEKTLQDLGLEALTADLVR